MTSVVLKILAAFSNSTRAGTKSSHENEIFLNAEILVLGSELLTSRMSCNVKDCDGN